MRKITEKDIKVVSAFVEKYPTATTFGGCGLALGVAAFFIGLAIDLKKRGV